MDTVSGPIDWSLGTYAPDYTKGALGAYQAGVGMAQQAGVRGALSEYANDPNASINDLVRYGALDHAQALINLDFARNKYAAIKRVAGGAAPGASPQPAAQAPASQAAAAPVSDAQLGSTTGQVAPPAAGAPPWLDALDNIEKAVSAAPVGQRRAMLQRYQETGAFDAMPDQIKASVTSYEPTDANLAQARAELSQARQHFASGGQAAPQEAPAAASAQGINLHDPETQAGLLPLALYAPEVANAYEKLGSYTTPNLEVAGGSVINKNDVGNVGRPVVPQGMKAVFDPDTKQWVTIPLEGYNAALAAQETAKTTAQEGAKAPFEFMEVKGQNGEPVNVRKDKAVAYAGEHGGVLSQGITPAEQKFQEGQAGQAAELLKPDEPGREHAADTEANARRAIAFVNSTKLDQTTGLKAKAASLLRTVGINAADNFANDAAAFNSISTQALTSGAHDVFPQRTTDRDIKLYNGVVPHLTTPNDAAKVFFGIQAAQAERKQAYEQFKADYQGDHSPQAIQRAWMQSGGAKSVFESPIWSEVQIGGKPSVVIKDVKGQKVGAFGIGTGHPVYFQVQ